MRQDKKHPEMRVRGAFYTTLKTFSIDKTYLFGQVFLCGVVEFFTRLTSWSWVVMTFSIFACRGALFLGDERVVSSLFAFSFPFVMDDKSPSKILSELFVLSLSTPDASEFFSFERLRKELKRLKIPNLSKIHPLKKRKKVKKTKKSLQKLLI